MDPSPTLETTALPTGSPKSESETKDFAEHLRSVHFALGVICLGLIVIATQPTRPELRTAYEQARDIGEVARHIDPNLIETEAARQAHAPDMMASPALGGVDSLPGAPKALDIDGNRYNVVFTGRNWGFLPSSPPNPMLKVGEFSGAPLPISSPTDLAGFRVLWDGLNHLVAWGGGNLSSYACFSQGSRLGATTETWHRWRSIPPSAKYKTLQFTLGTFQFTDDVAIPPDIRSHFKHVYAAEGGQPQVLIPAISETPVAIVDGQALLIRAVQGRWRHGPYVRAFEELYAVTQNYETVNLETIERIVGSELERSKDVFQAFGISFPVETTAAWGVMMVVAVQFYFLFHLAEFRHRHMQNVTVAWIGLYRGWGPRLLYVVSSCLVPVAVVAYVAPKSGVARSISWIPPWSIPGLFIILSLAVSIMSAREYYRIQTAMT